jgi:hypothetical protein
MCSSYRWRMPLALLACGLGLLPALAQGQVITFEDLSLGANSYQNGSGMTGGGFTSGGVRFSNHYEVDPTYGYPYWYGWAYSNKTDKTTPDYTNEFSSITGGGYGGSAKYALAYQDQLFAAPPTITLPRDSTVAGAYFTNTTYDYYTVRDGNAFSRKFGRSVDGAGHTVSETDAPDWFKVTIIGKDSGGVETGSVDFFLADYQFDNHAQDYVVNNWTWVNLSDLHDNVRTLEFTFSSTDNDDIWGMNTPAFVAMDNLTIVPEPAAWLLAAGALIMLWLWKRRIIT